MSHNIKKNAIIYGSFASSNGFTIIPEGRYHSKSFLKNRSLPLCNLHTILSNCKTVIPHDEVLHIKQCMEELTNIMEEKGELSDKDFDRLNIRLVGGESSKDDLVVYRRGGCILANYAFIKAGLDAVRVATETSAAKAAEAEARRKQATKRKEDAHAAKQAKEKAKADKANKPGAKAKKATETGNEKLVLKRPAYPFK